jgi:hypothetical protein
MTAQTPERIIIDDEPRALYADPLYRLLASSRFKLGAYATERSTACYRGYCGTWEIIDRRLYLVHLNLMGWREEPIPHDLRAKLLRVARCKDFPIAARWFNGTLRIQIGRRLVYSHHGWSNWFERERVVTIIGGDVQRDREVDTKAMLERYLRRNPHMHDVLDSSAQPSGFGPLVWLDDSEEDEKDWWPPDYVRGKL